MVLRPAIWIFWTHLNGQVAGSEQLIFLTTLAGRDVPYWLHMTWLTADSLLRHYFSISQDYVYVFWFSEGLFELLQLAREYHHFEPQTFKQFHSHSLYNRLEGFQLKFAGVECNDKGGGIQNQKKKTRRLL